MPWAYPPPYLPYRALRTSCGRNTSVSNQFMLDTSLRMTYDICYKNTVVHGCMWYKQNVPQRGRETPHLDTREDKFLRSSTY